VKYGENREEGESDWLTLFDVVLVCACMPFTMLFLMCSFGVHKTLMGLHEIFCMKYFH